MSAINFVDLGGGRIGWLKHRSTASTAAERHHHGLVALRKVTRRLAAGSKGTDAERHYAQGMQFLGLMTMPALISAYPYLPEPRIGVESSLAGLVCDIPRIFHDTLSPSHRQRAAIAADTTIIVERLPDLSWSFRVFLRSRSVSQVMAWRLKAATCERAARRTALKLELIAESLREGAFSTRRPPPAKDPPREAPVRDTVPVVQRPSRSAPPPLAAGPGVAISAATRSTASTNQSPPAADSTRTVVLGPKVFVARGRRPAPRGRSPVGVRVRVAARAGYGVLPQNAFGGAQLHAGVVTRHASVELGGTFSGGRPLVIREVDQIRRAYHTSLQLHGCGELAEGSINLRVCLGLEGGLLAMKTESSPVRPWTLHITGSPSVTWWWHRHLGLNAGLTVGPALVRPVFYFGPGPGADAIAEPGVPTFLISGSLGLEFRFPASRDKDEQAP